VFFFFNPARSLITCSTLSRFSSATAFTMWCFVNALQNSNFLIWKNHIILLQSSILKDKKLILG
jgi:hypothetical protein